MENLYGSLDQKQREIRLITLDPGSDDDPLCCSLEPVSLNKQPPYEAVSYVWGSSHPDRCKPIAVNKQLVPIPRNLEKALQNLRSPTSLRILWADAICINQSDDQERTHQVELMATIYKSASKVLIWLGSSNTESETAFAFIRSQKKLPVREYQQYMEENHDHYDTSFEALCKLLKRGWFTRVWTMQEFAFGPDPQMICGKDELDWNSFYELGWKDNNFRKYCLEENYASPLIAYFQNAQEYWSIVSTRHTIRQCSGVGYQLHYLLHATAHFAASDPRDRIYALLGLSEHPFRQEIKPDYTQSKDEAYIKVVKCIIKIDKSLNILAFQASPRGLDDSPPEVPKPNDLGSWALNFDTLPSWVPDFSVSLSKHCRHLLPRDLEGPGMRDLMPPSLWVQYWATGPSRPIIGFSRDNTHLSVKGVRFGRVCEVVGPFGSLKSYLRQAEQCAGRAVPKSLPRRHLIRVLHRLLRPGKSLWRAVIADKDETGLVPAPLRYKTTIKAMLSEARIPASPTSHCANESPHLASVERSLQAAIANRRFFRTDYGFVGIGPSDMQEGDVVSVMFGADMPFILRSYGVFQTLVGAAYVHGIMRGEGVAYYDNLHHRGFPTWTFHLH